MFPHCSSTLAGTLLNLIHLSSAVCLVCNAWQRPSFTVHPAVFHMYLSQAKTDARGERESRNQFSLACMKYRFTSPEGWCVNGSFSQIASQNCNFEDVFGLARVGCKRWKNTNCCNTFELFWGSKLNVKEH